MPESVTYSITTVQGAQAVGVAHLLDILVRELLNRRLQVRQRVLAQRPLLLELAGLVIN